MKKKKILFAAMLVMMLAPFSSAQAQDRLNLACTYDSGRQTLFAIDLHNHTVAEPANGTSAAANITESTFSWTLRVTGYQPTASSINRYTGVIETQIIDPQTGKPIDAPLRGKCATATKQF
jgi:hypothetical protein